MSDFDDVFVSVETKEPAQSKEERRTTPKEWWQIREQKEREQAYLSLDRIFADFSEGKGNLCEYLDTYGRIDRYSFRNVLLIHKKCPHATWPGNYGYWKSKGVDILRTERRNPIIILEPGGTYQRQDGSIGQNYYAKEIFDVSQTTARGETRNRPNFDDRSLLKALISKSPVPIEVAENFQKEGKGAIYDQEQKKIFVRQGMEAQDIFRCVSFELAKAELERLDGEYTPEDVHKAYCISYLLCRKYGIDTQGYDKDSLNQTFVGKNSKEIGMELNSLENAIGAINHRMSRTLRESFKGAVSKDYER